MTTTTTLETKSEFQQYYNDDLDIDTFHVTLDLGRLSPSQELFSIHQNPYLRGFSPQTTPFSISKAAEFLKEVENIPGFVSFESERIDDDLNTVYLVFQKSPYGSVTAKFDEIYTNLRIGKIFHRSFPGSLSLDQEKNLNELLAHFDQVKMLEQSHSSGQFIEPAVFQLMKQTVDVLESTMAQDLDEVEEDKGMDEKTPKVRNRALESVMDIKPSLSTESMTDSAYASGKGSQIPSRTDTPSFDKAGENIFNLAELFDTQVSEK